MALFFNDVVPGLGWSFFLLMNSGHVLNVYLWDHDANEFYRKFTDSLQTPTDLLIGTQYPFYSLCNLLSSCRISHLLISDVYYIRFHFYKPVLNYRWLAQTQDVAAMVNASEVTKVKTLTIREIFALLETGTSSVIAKLKYHSEMLAYAKVKKAIFVRLGDAGPELTGRQALALIDNYFEANGDIGAHHEMPAPQCLLDIIGQTHKFTVKVSDYKFTGMRQTITVTKIVSLALLPSLAQAVEIPVIQVKILTSFLGQV